MINDYLPPSSISVTGWRDAEVCGVCGRDWLAHDIPVPTVYTNASIQASDVLLEPICDHCVEERDPELFLELLAHRRRLWAKRIGGVSWIGGGRAAVV